MRVAPRADSAFEEPCDTVGYYDEIAGHYASQMPDWHGAACRQADALHRLIVAALGPGQFSVLDCTCGVGTQAIELARRGHRVVGTDLSVGAITQARRFAREFAVAAEFAVADVRRIGHELDGEFDVVLSIDNSLPHLLTADDMLAAVAGMYRRLRPGGLVLVSTRDYDRHLQHRPRATQPEVWEGSEGNRVVFQTWEWLSNDVYRAALFVLDQRSGRWELRTHDGPTYRAWRRSELSDFLRRAGFVGVEWALPTEFHQPIVLGRRPSRDASA